MNSPLALFVGSFHNAQRSDQECFQVVRSNLLLSVLDLLTINGYILGYSHAAATTKVYLKQPFTKRYKLELLSKSSKKSYASVAYLSKKFSKNDFILISSSYGVITLQEAYILGCGGELLLRIN